MKKIATIAFLSFSVCAAVYGSGIMLYTRGGASYVSIVYYSKINSPGAHIKNLSLKDGRSFQVRTGEIIADIPYPESTIKIDLDSISSLIAQTEMLSTRHPQYSSVLTSISNAWKKVLTEQQQKAADLLQEQKEDDERQKKIEVDEQRTGEIANRELQAREHLREEQQKILVQSEINILSKLADSVSWAIESNNLNRKSLFEHSGIDENNWEQFVEKSLASQDSEKTTELLASSRFAIDKRYVLSFSKIFLIVDIATQNRMSIALLELETLIGPNESENTLRAGAKRLFSPLADALKKKITESDTLRQQAQDLFNKKKYSAACELFGKASVIDRRENDEDILKKCKDLELKHALETLGI